MPLSLSALKLSSVKRCRSFFISSGFNIFATFARKRIFAEFLTAFIIPSFCVCISCIVGLSVRVVLSEKVVCVFKVCYNAYMFKLYSSMLAICKQIP